MSAQKIKAAVSDGRVIYIDVLRIFSVFCMMMLHVAASKWSVAPVESFDWQAFNVYDSIVRFCVPVFIMISGGFFLDNSREFDLKKLFKKNIARIVSAFFFWSFCYSIVIYIISPDKSAYSFGDWFKSFICGRYHLWFLFTICGLYLIVPFLRKITADKKLTEYFLILSFVFCNVFMLLKSITPISKTASTVLSQFNMQYVLGYTGYFVLGYYLKSNELSKKTQTIVYILGAIGLAATITVSSLWSVGKGAPMKQFYNNFMPNVYFESVAVFVFFKYNVSKINWSEKWLKIISKLSALSFGMYLFHDFVNIAFGEWGFTTLTYNSALSVPCNTLIVFFVSMAAAYLISKIPFINRYII